MTKEAKVLRIPGVPNERQKLFFASKATYTAYGGARGGGKSWALRRKLVGLCLKYPGIRCLLVRRSYAELKSNHVEPLLREYKDLLTYRDSEKAILFPNGSRICLGYCASTRDTLRYQGQEYDVIAIDEATQLSESQFGIFKACLRGVDDFPKRIYLTCNPGGIGHAWVKRLFIDRDFRAGENPNDYRFIPAKVYDNPVLLAASPDYIERLESLPGRLRDAWLDGRWDVFEGQFFPEFSEDYHVISLGELPEPLSYFVAMDYGLDLLAALLLGVDRAGNLFVVGELCKKDLTLSSAAEAVANFCRGYAVTYAVASPDLWNRRQDSGKSGFECMQKVPGMPPMQAADDRRVPGWRILREYLTRNKEKPQLRIVNSCKTLIHSLSSLLCDPNRAEDAAGEPHAITHAPEALRYGVMSRSRFYEANEPDRNFHFSNAKKGTSFI